MFISPCFFFEKKTFLVNEFGHQPDLEPSEPQTKVTKVSCNEKFSVQVKGKQPKDFKKFKKKLFDFLNF